MNVRTKFKVVSVTQQENGVNSVTLHTVTSGSPENASFFKWTPSGEIKIGTINQDAAAQFKPGQEFYMDFTAVPKAEPAAA